MGIFWGVLKRIIGMISNDDDVDDIDDMDGDDEFEEDDDVDDIDDMDSDDEFEEDDDIDDIDDVDDIGCFEMVEDMTEPDNADSSFETVEWFRELIESKKAISFTGLSDRGLEKSNAYQSWIDGVGIFEITPKDISEVATHIAEEFSQAIPEIKHEWFSGGFATNTVGNGTIFYDGVSIIKNSLNGYGASNIVGSVAHEMGHNIVSRVFSNEALSRLEKEIGADYMEGVVFGMTGIDPSEKFEWLKIHNTESAFYLASDGRINVIEEGIQWGKKLRILKDDFPNADIGSIEILSDRLKSVMDKYVRN